MGGVDLCPWCDCGVERDGKPWDLSKMLERSFADQNLVLVTNFNEATPAFPEADMDDQPMSVTRGIRSLLPSFSREDLEELADAIAKELKERNH